MGRAPLINSGGASSGEGDLKEAIRTAVINKRAGGTGLISGRKAFQRPMQEGAALLTAIQDVYLSKDDRLSVGADSLGRGCKARRCETYPEQLPQRVVRALEGEFVPRNLVGREEPRFEPLVIAGQAPADHRCRVDDDHRRFARDTSRR